MFHWWFDTCLGDSKGVIDPQRFLSGRIKLSANWLTVYVENSLKMEVEKEDKYCYVTPFFCH